MGTIYLWCAFILHLIERIICIPLASQVSISRRLWCAYKNVSVRIVTPMRQTKKRTWRILLVISLITNNRQVRPARAYLGITAVLSTLFKNPGQEHVWTMDLTSILILLCLSISGSTAECFDLCKGHPEMTGRYHYHQAPLCVISEWVYTYCNHQDWTAKECTGVRIRVWLCACVGEEWNGEHLSWADTSRIKLARTPPPPPEWESTHDFTNTSLRHY